MPFVVTSTNYAQANFQYLFDIYVSGVTGYIRIAVPSDPTYTQGYLDVSRVLRNYVNQNGSEDITENEFGFHKCTNSLIAYEVKVGEQYGVASGVTNYTDLTVTGTKYGHNEVLNPHDYNLYVGANQPIETSGDVLSNKPLTTYMPSTQPNDMYLHYLTGTSGTIYFLQIQTYDSSGSLLGTYKIANSFQAVSTYDMRRMRVACGVYQLNAATLYSGVQPVIDNNVYRYVLNLTNFAGSAQTPAHTVYIDSRCFPIGRQHYQLHWKNIRGGYDSFVFPLVSRFKRDIKRETFDRKLGQLSNHTWSYQDLDAGTTVIDTVLTPRWELTTDWISEDESLWLMELIESPVVYFYDSLYYYRCIVTSPVESERKTIDNSVLFNLTITIELSMKEWRQHS